MTLRQSSLKVVHSRFRLPPSSLHLKDPRTLLDNVIVAVPMSTEILAVASTTIIN